jgi:hypothetical protein
MLGALAAWPAAANEAATVVQLPFAQTLDMRKVQAATRSAPQELLATIAGFGIDVLRVPGIAAGRSANPLLAGLPAAAPELLRNADFRDSYEGRVVLRGAPCCGLDRDTILIRETASTYTLLHEVVQSLLPPNGVDATGADLELQFAVNFRRLRIYQRCVTDDPLRLLDPRWRRDLLAALDDLVPLLFGRIRMGQSQEAIVEKVLAREIGTNSPYHDAARQEQGRRYGALMLDNAIDLFNTVHEAIVSAERSVQQLRGAIAAGEITPAGTDSLTEEEQRAFEQRLRGAKAGLEPVRAEIEAAKRFYLQP